MTPLVTPQTFDDEAIKSGPSNTSLWDALDLKLYSTDRPVRPAVTQTLVSLHLTSVLQPRLQTIG